MVALTNTEVKVRRSYARRGMTAHPT